MATMTAPSSTPPLNWSVRGQLSLMMFLQFAIWGAWFTNFYNYCTYYGFSDTQAGALVGNVALGAIFSMLFTGYIADRFFDSEKLLGVCHLLGAAALYLIAQVQNPADYWSLFALTLVYALLYNPTLVLANSITFRHVPDATRDFPGIRVLGTLGWIGIAYVVDLLFVRTVTEDDGLLKVLPAFTTNNILLLASGLSAVLGVYSFLLPKTPPLGRKGDAVPIVKALGLFRDPSFAVFFGVSLVITVVLAFYYTVTGQFLGVKGAVHVVNVTSFMTIGQICELIFLPLLPIFLWRLGMKWVLALGMLCWGLRYLCFSQAGSEGFPFALAVVGVALHGLCFDFFFAAGFIHCDNEAPADIKASAQALFSFLTYGIGMWLGSLAAGQLKKYYTVPGTEVVDWQSFWLVPAVGVLICCAVFVLFFRVSKSRVSTGMNSDVNSPVSASAELGAS